MSVDGLAPKASSRLRGGEQIAFTVPPPEPIRALPEDLPLSVLYEDPDLLVLDKAAGMVVHPARGSPRSTVVNALLHRLGQGAAPPRLGLVHRLDKDTSGCLLVARTEEALARLQEQWKGRTVLKVYLALCHGELAEAGRFDTPYGRHPRDRTRFTGRVESPRRALTTWTVRERFLAMATLAEVVLHTGRTHQNPCPLLRGRAPSARRRRLWRRSARGEAARPAPGPPFGPGDGPPGSPRPSARLRSPADGAAAHLRGPLAGGLLPRAPGAQGG